MAADPKRRMIRTESLMDLTQLLEKELIVEAVYKDKAAEEIKIAEHNEHAHDADDNDDDTKIEQNLDNGKIVQTKRYRMPLQFMYHKHRFMWIDNPSVDCKELISFHATLDKYQTSIFERYGWKPSMKQRIDIDCNACLLGFAVHDETNAIMAMITFFDVSDSPEKLYNVEKEMSLCVLPPFQRRHLATDLVRLAWALFVPDEAKECWIYVMNSMKSGIFWRKFQQWYPDVRFRLVRP
mmetsp:Transcript_12144/g.19441  ORF Transcript_12144/g.19441 Transcript_12144/m.19441 type:complete len:238 (+) Transcript_12144:66-779(+)